MTVIASLELPRYGVRANCIGPGGFTRMVGQAMKDIEIKNPEDYTEFDRMNPANSAPAVVWLASDDSKPVTGQVLRMVGNSLCVYQPWEMGEEFFATDKEGNPDAVGAEPGRAHPQSLRLPHHEPGHRRTAEGLTCTSPPWFGSLRCTIRAPQALAYLHGSARCGARYVRRRRSPHAAPKNPRCTMVVSVSSIASSSSTTCAPTTRRS